MADTAVVGILRALLTADTAQFDAGMKKAVQTTHTTEKAISGLGSEVKKLTPQAERMVKAFQGDKLLYQANNLVASVQKLGGVGKLTESEMKRVNGTITEAINKYKALGQQAPKALLDMQKATSGAVAPTQFLTAKMVALGAATGTMVAQLAGRAIRGVIEFGKEAFRSAGAIVDLSSKTGLGTRTIQEMQFVAEQTGTTLDAMTDASFKLGVRVAGGGDSVAGAFRELGLDLQRVQAMRPDQMWDTVVTALGKVESATERNRLGTILFGRSFASVAGAVAEGYRNIANQATVATDSQLRELERLGDEWTKFRKNLVTGFAAAMGEIVLRNRITAEVMREQVAKGIFSSESSNEFKAEVERRLRLGLSNQRTTDIKLLAEETVAQKTYAQQLAAVRAELAKLTPAQRAEIDAALELGVNTDDLEDKFGLQNGTLRLYVAAAKNAEKASKDLAKSQKELAKDTEEANRRWLDIIGSIEAAQIKEDAAFRKAERGDGTAGIFDRSDPTAVRQTELDNLEAIGRIFEAQDKAAAEHRQFLNFIGERILEDEGRQIEERKRRIQEFNQFVQQLFQPLVSGVGDALGGLLFGDGQNRQKPKRGTMSAEEYTRAMREFEGRWDAFLKRIGRGAADMFKNILNMFVNQFLGGMIRALAGSSLGQAFGNFLAKSLGIAGGGGGLLGNASGAVAGVIGLGGGSTVLGASAAPSLAAVLGPAPAGAAGTAGTVAGLSSAIGKLVPLIGAAAGVFGLVKNKGLGSNLLSGVTAGASIGSIVPGIGTAIGAAVGGIVGGLRSLFSGGNQDPRKAFGGHAWNTIQAKKAAAFTPPSVSMPSMTGVSLANNTGTATNLSQAAGRNGAQNHVHFHLVDSKGIERLISNPTFTNKLSSAFENNTGFLGSRVSRALNR